jgi:hypothetical protein
MPNPQLKLAAEEIKEVLRKYDIAGLVTLQVPGELACVRELSPSWSCATIVDDPQHGAGIQLRAMLEDFTDEEAQEKRIGDTLAMLDNFARQAKQDGQVLQDTRYEACKRYRIIFEGEE